MTKLRLSHEERVLCGLAIDPGVSALEKPQEDEAKSDSARIPAGFIPDEELGIEHVQAGFLNESQRQACMDPLEYAVAKRDPEQYGAKSLGRNLRLC